MGVRINSNIQSIRAQFSLAQTSKKMNKTLTRLATGLKINGTDDDVVGMSKSEGIRYQINNINQAKVNISNTEGVMNVTEGYLTKLTDLTQELRAVAVQAADDTLGTSERQAVSSYFDDLLTEFDRLAGGANYNGVNLLNGTFTSEVVQIGPDTSDTMAMSISDTRTTSVGEVALYTAETRAVYSTAATMSASFAGPAINIDINSTPVPLGSFTDDGVSAVESTESAISYVAAINSIAGVTGVTASNPSNTVSIDYTAGVALEANQQLSINGIMFKSDSMSMALGDDAGAANLASLINDISAKSGVTASLDASTDTITLEASDGRNINFMVSAAGAVSLSHDVFGITNGANNTQMTQRGTFRLVSDTTFDIDNAQNEFTGAINEVVALDATTSLSNADVSTQSNSENAIFILDNVMLQLASERASIGSYLTQLGNAGEELNGREETLAQSRSIIRDSDIAIETAELTKYQILQQAGVSVLAQANTTPRALLSLLSTR